MKKAILLILAAGIISGCSHKPVPMLPAADQFRTARSLYEKKKYYKAQLEFEKLIYTYPGNTVVDTAQYYLGMSYYGQRDYTTAAGEFERLLASYPQSAYADDAQYQIGMCHYKMSPKYQLDQAETNLAIEAFQSLLSNFAGSSLIEDGRAKIRELEDKLARKKFMAGILYLKMSDYDPAMVYFWSVRDEYPSTDWAIQAVFYTGEALLQLKQYAKAQETFINFLTGFPVHKLAAKAKQKIEHIKNKTERASG